MMRYSFQDFLDYQNELNDKYDQKVVDAMIDGVLTELRRYIEIHPTTHSYSIVGYYVKKNSRTIDFNLFSSGYSLKELKTVKEYLENMGFTVDYLKHPLSNDSTFNDSVDKIEGFILTW